MIVHKSNSSLDNAASTSSKEEKKEDIRNEERVVGVVDTWELMVSVTVPRKIQCPELADCHSSYTRSRFRFSSFIIAVLYLQKPAW